MRGAGWCMREDRFFMRNNEHNGLFNFFFISACVLIGTALIPYIMVFAKNGVSNAPDDWGIFGDYFGGILNPLLAFLALIALLVTIKLQINELSITRKEFEKSSNALIAQQKLLERQNFENTFFRLLSLHHDIVDQIRYNRAVLSYDFSRNTESYQGRQCFRVLYDDDLIHCLREDPSNFSEMYDLFYDSHGEKIGHYFRNLYHIFKFIESADIPNDDKSRYGSLVRAQLSNYELVMLFYNGLSKHGEKFKEKIERYRMFENMPDKFITLTPGARLSYRDDAYGDALKDYQKYP